MASASFSSSSDAVFRRGLRPAGEGLLGGPHGGVDLGLEASCTFASTSPAPG